MSSACLALPKNNSTATVQWCAVWTEPNRELAVSVRLVDQGVECYLPIQHVRRIYKSRARTFEVPFYPSYLFAAYRNESQRYDIRCTRYVADLLLTSHEHAQEKLTGDIQSLKRVLEADPMADATAWAMAGRKVIVTAGAFRGIRGEIIKRERKVRDRTIVKDILCVGVTMLGRVVEVEIDPAFCEPVDQ